MADRTDPVAFGVAGAWSGLVWLGQHYISHRIYGESETFAGIWIVNSRGGVATATRTGKIFPIRTILQRNLCQANKLFCHSYDVFSVLTNT